MSLFQKKPVSKILEELESNATDRLLHSLMATQLVALGTSKAAAKVRVRRALVKLRTAFARRDVVVSTTALLAAFRAPNKSRGRFTECRWVRKVDELSIARHDEMAGSQGTSHFYADLQLRRRGGANTVP